ncbi:MAG: hybrid sensor histidine kinase/response regulator [Planctomycetota bacterium]|nr:MAG: hybrid sensor histidine kinase/response regulator [Planctomycetota bacterium]
MERDEEFQEFLEIFQEESLERLVAVSRALQDLAGGLPEAEQSERLDEVDRELHTIKGSARLLGFQELAALVHDIESLARVQRGRRELELELLVEATDRLAALVERAASDGEDVGDETLRVRVAQTLAALREAALSGKEDAPSAKASSDSATRSGATESGRAPEGPEAPKTGEGGPEETRSAAQVPPTEMGTEPRDGGDGVALPEHAPVGAVRGARPEDETVRVRASRLADLDGIVSELALSRQRLHAHAFRLREISRSLEEGADPGLILSALGRAVQDYRADLLDIHTSTKALERLAVDVRLRPASYLFDRIPREARELARRLGKRVRVRLRGEETELDRGILDSLKSPLSHVLRNAIDHGIESPEQRVAAGKPPEGQLTVSAGQEGNRVVIRIEDDGAGIDPRRMRETAVQRGIIEEAEAAALDDESALQLVFAAGLTTRDVATQISGRGVGMNAIRSAVEELKGEVRVTSETGQGTCVLLRLPLTLLVSRVTLLRSGGQLFAIPTEAVEESLRSPREGVARFAGKPALVRGRTSIPLAELATVLGQAKLPPPDFLQVVVVRHAGERLALVVDEVIEERSVVVKPLGWPLERLPWIAGAVLMPDGEVALQLHVPQLFVGMRGPDPTGREKEKLLEGSRSILIVDDSIVSRQLVARTVASLGFDPVTAVDGVEAWSLLERIRPQLVVTDVEMPRLDGLALVRRIRRDERLRDLPVIIFSNRGAEQDRHAGLRAGADAYITKAEFNQESFRSVIERML